MKNSLASIFNYIAINNLNHSFPNITNALDILLIIPVSLATAKSFSKILAASAHDYCL